MSELKQLLETIGFQKTETHLNSGNILMDSEMRILTERQHIIAF